MARHRASPRQRWQLVTWPSRLLFLAAVFFSFSAIGFVADILDLGNSSFRHLVASVLYSGAIAVGCAYASMARKPWRVILVVVVLAILGPFFIGTEAVPGSPNRRAVFVILGDNAGAQAGRLKLDALGCFGSMVLGYMFFVSFIGRELNRSARLQAEMSLARDLHASVVPPIRAEGAGYELYGRSLPAAEVGGDLVDFVAREGTVTMLVADVAGHGVRAGAFMAMFKAAVRARLLAPGPLEAVLGDVNRAVFEVKQPNMFVTAAFLELRAGKAAYALAGHLPLLHLRLEDGRIEQLSVRQAAFGVKRDEKYASTPIEARPGDVVALLTDGLTEVSRRGLQLGIEAIERTLLAGNRRPLPELFDAIVATALAHGEQRDDQTLLLLRLR